MKREAEQLHTTPAELERELAAEPPRCMKCGSTVLVRTYTIAVDGETLEATAGIRLCQDHGESLLMKFGCAVGEVLR